MCTAILSAGIRCDHRVNKTSPDAEAVAVRCVARVALARPATRPRNQPRSTVAEPRVRGARVRPPSREPKPRVPPRVSKPLPRRFGSPSASPTRDYQEAFQVVHREVMLPSGVEDGACAQPQQRRQRQCVPDSRQAVQGDPRDGPRARAQGLAGVQVAQGQPRVGGQGSGGANLREGPDQDEPPRM